MSSIRRLSRRLGLGRSLLRMWLPIKEFRNTGPKAVLQTRSVRKHILPQITQARPIAAGDGVFEIHMLLQKKRVLEGAWALYSFLSHAGVPLHAVVHSDGSLDTGCSDLLARLFPGITVISREHADKVVTPVLEKAGLRNCGELRRRLIYGLKLLDPYILCKSTSYILMDSDILTFAYPEELIQPDYGAANGRIPHLYAPDNSEGQYSRRPEVLRSILGVDVPPRLNSGLLKIQRSGISLERMEGILEKLGLLREDPINFFVDQTLYACELPVHGALSLNPQRYTICGDPRGPETVTGHYCGDGFWATRFYREGLPRLVEQLAL